MSLSTRDIKRRIKSVKNTSKITKAMEMISAVKMSKSVKLVLASRAYAQAAWRFLNNLALKIEPEKHLFFQARPPKKIAIVLITSNRGLCSSFNQQVAKLVLDYRKNLPRDVEVEIITLGKKGRDIILKFGINLKIIADFQKSDVIYNSLEIAPIANLIIDSFLEKTYDRVFIAYTDYVSTLKQIPRLTQILPLGKKDEFLGEVKVKKETEADKIEKEIDLSFSEYFFDVAPEILLDYLLKRLVEMQIYQAVLEANASEHSARMMAMRNATEAASDLVTELTLIYNQARQTAITKEIVEISAGRAALEG